VRVVHLAPFVEGGYTGGMQRYVMDLVREQRCAGIDASVYTVRLTKDVCVRDVPTTGRRASFVWQRTPVQPLMPKDLRAIEADVVHLHSPSPTLEAALLIAQPKMSRLVVTVHNDLPRTTRVQRALGHVEGRILSRVLRRSVAVIMPHEAFATDVAPRFGLDAGDQRLSVVPPGVDHSHFRDLGLERDPDTVLFVGHVRPEKGLHVLVEAMGHLPRLRLEVVAAVSYESNYYEGVKRRAVAHLGERVVFRENLTPDELAEAYNRTGVVVAPSLGLESWNLVLLEAAATGAACVRTDLPGLRWADFAVEAPAGDATALARAIEAAIGRRDELGCKGKQRAYEYSWDRTCRETLATYMAA
jgi:phosphatidylinositol alpha-mannosyltransferase